jgi:D-sedoheptulose 7-phosphate isomerase
MAQSSDPLNQLYPFLHAESKDPERERAALLESIQQKAAHSLSIKEKFFAENASALAVTQVILPSSFSTQ